MERLRGLHIHLFVIFPIPPCPPAAFLHGVVTDTFQLFPLRVNFLDEELSGDDLSQLTWQDLFYATRDFTYRLCTCVTCGYIPRSAHRSIRPYHRAVDRKSVHAEAKFPSQSTFGGCDVPTHSIGNILSRNPPKRHSACTPFLKIAPSPR